MLSASSARHWAITSIIAGALVGVGFSVPWFFASDAPSITLAGSGWQVLVGIFANTREAFQVGSISPFFALLLALFVLLPLVAVFLLVIGVLGLTGRAAPWMVRTEIIVGWVSVVALALGVGLVEVIFYALANFDTPNPNAALIPGVGVWLMVAGLLTALVSGIRFRRAGRQQDRGTAPTS